MEISSQIPKRYLNIDEVASYLEISSTTIYSMVQERSIPFIKLGGKKLIRFDVKAIDKWMEKQIIPPKPKIDFIPQEKI